MIRQEVCSSILGSDFHDDRKSYKGLITHLVCSRDQGSSSALITSVSHTGIEWLLGEQT